ncbi:hypothetical protein [Thiorhodovibrio frisius]|uniref:hypothetical protein n=1 Tax=Thiorhodovibrio frisius TaxID=631362 RepID=UPI00167F7936|nr:hypothetical protein [Thiorhodovibrio frisius]
MRDISGLLDRLEDPVSFGSAAYSSDKTLLSTFSANLETLPGASDDSKTMDWWKKEQEA